MKYPAGSQCHRRTFGSLTLVRTLRTLDFSPSIYTSVKNGRFYDYPIVDMLKHRLP
jgi:hypothetical protein